MTNDDIERSDPYRAFRGTYDAWLHWNLTERCFMGCPYCFDAASTDRRRASVSPIDIPVLLHTLEATGRTFRISFTGGGEPFLVPNLVQACTEITKAHYVSFNTNLVEVDIGQFAEEVDPERVLSIHASCHIKSLERRGLLDRFVNNVLTCMKRGFPLNAIAVGYPPLVDEAQEYRELFAKHGIVLKFSEFIGQYDGKTYPDAYTAEEMEALGINRHSVRIHYPGSDGRIAFCNAGYNVAVVDPNGEVTLCNDIGENIGNIYRKIEFRRHVTVCPLVSCGCPLWAYDQGLFERAQKEDRWSMWRRRIVARFLR